MTLVDSQGNFKDEYQALRDCLEAFKFLLNQLKQQDLSSWRIEMESLERSHLNIQELFQTQILDQIDRTSANEEEISYYVEINKQLKLLEADLKLLKITRNPEALTKRVNQARDRLTLLLTYCNSLLE